MSEERDSARVRARKKVRESDEREATGNASSNVWDKGLKKNRLQK